MLKAQLSKYSRKGKYRVVLENTLYKKGMTRKYYTKEDKYVIL